MIWHVHFSLFTIIKNGDSLCSALMTFVFLNLLLPGFVFSLNQLHSITYHIDYRIIFFLTKAELSLFLRLALFRFTIIIIYAFVLRCEWSEFVSLSSLMNCVNISMNLWLQYINLVCVSILNLVLNQWQWHFVPPTFEWGVPGVCLFVILKTLLK